MTNTYDTAALPIGTADAKAFFNNVSNFDDLMLGPSPSYPDRKLRRRQSWAGMEKLVTDFLQEMGFEAAHLQYVDGVPLTVLRPTQLIDRAPSVYKVLSPATFPLMLTGTWATDQLLLVDVGDSPLRSELADAITLSKGATMVGRATPQIRSLAELKTYTGRYDKDVVLMVGRDLATPGRGDQHYRWDASSTATANDANIVQVTAVTIGRWVAFGRQTVRASDWGMYGDGTDITAKFASMMAYIAALGNIGVHATVEWAAGDYVKSACPNLAYRGLVFDPKGEVTFTNTGAGPNLLIDFGPTAGMKGDGVYIGSPGNPITLRGGSATGDGIYCRAFVGNGTIAANVHGCGTGARAFRSEWSVLIDLYLNITPGDLSTGSLAWYLGGVPAVGVSLGQRLPGEQTAYCQFWNLKATGCNVGIYLDSTLGNNFWGGDSEYSIATGLLTTVNALKDKFWGMNFEVNPNDVNCVGNGVRFIGCDAVAFTVGAAAVNCKFLDCLTDALTVVAGAVGTEIAHTSFSRGLSSTDITDAGTQSSHVSNYNMTTNKYQNAPRVVLTLPVTLPINWKNTTGASVLVQLAGGTLSNVSIVAANGVDTIVVGTAIVGRQLIMNEESLTVTGTVNPTTLKAFRGV